MKKGKGKELVLVDSQECFKKYGVSNGDLMTCPMGVEIQIVGMGKDSRLYAKFEGNIISPLESLNQEDLLRSGYKPKNFEKIIHQEEIMRGLVKGRNCVLLATTCRFDDPGPSSAEMVKDYFLKQLESGAVAKAREDKLKAAEKKSKKSKKSKK